MSVRNDISGLRSFISREENWRQRLQDVVGEHLMPALEEFDIDHDELADVLGEPWAGALWGCGFEDFLGRRYGEENIVDLYLKRRGWRETALNRAYFAALRDAPVSLYEVGGVEPGVSMVLNDLLANAAPVIVREKSATQSLKKWDRIAVRVVTEHEHHVISGALLPFSADAVDLLLAGLRDALRLKKSDVLRLTRDQLRGCAPVFTSAWLFTELPRILTPAQPRLCNSDGDEIVFHDLRFPLATGVKQKDVAARLDKAKGLLAESRQFWNWVAPRKGRAGRSADGLMLETQIDGGTMLGSLELKGKALQVSVNSARRAAKVEALLIAAAGKLLGRPLTTIRTVEQMLAEKHDAQRQDEADEIPPEIARQVARDYLDNHYRETLDAPIPALGGKSPRQAVRSAAGREKVIEWLKVLENRSARHDDGPIAEYDFGWMWAELGLQERRN
ncbi:MAG: hypothetical protein GC155_08650 [Alphaproteobacteria bacterium]|nr:hypothetical protein [Alphaproteobacteria bacterium]